jgi:hypothetical protein
LVALTLDLMGVTLAADSSVVFAPTSLVIFGAGFLVSVVVAIVVISDSVCNCLLQGLKSDPVNS